MTKHLDTLTGEALQKVFEEHVALGKTLSPQPADRMLIAYAYFKQALEGDNTHDRPVHSDVIRTFKHDAWARLAGMDREAAMRKYIQEIKEMTAEEGL